jgi:peptide/nickel transport system permease protein
LSNEQEHPEEAPPDDPRTSPEDEMRESIPLLLARNTMRVRAVPKPPPPPLEARRTETVVRAALPTLAQSRLGAAGMLVAALLFMVAVFADVLARDGPLLAKAHGQLYVFPNLTQAEGADKDVSFAIRPLVRHGPTRMDARVLLPPGSPGHPFGTDRVGRDVFAGVVHASRSYLVFALAAVLAAMLLGALLGGLAGIRGGGTDALVGRAVETISAFPPLVLVIGIQAAVPQATLATLFFAIAVTRWPEVARLVRAEVLTAATRDYVLAARALGASPLRMLRRHIAPNVRGPLVVGAATSVSTVVLIEASLDFLRVGAPAGTASWGETMSQFRDAPQAWWLLAFPGAFLIATVVGHTLLGEALRDKLDPRTR